MAARRRLLGAATLTIALASCGFRMRGAEPLPFRTLYSSLPRSSPLGAELRRATRSAGGTVVDRREDAQVSFELIAEVIERDISALSVSGRPREFELRMRLRWRATDAAGAELVPPSDLTMRRYVNVIDTQGIATQDEEALLYRDMRVDAVQQILRRLSAVKVPG